MDATITMFTTNGYRMPSAEDRVIVICTDAKNGRYWRVSQTNQREEIKNLPRYQKRKIILSFINTKKLMIIVLQIFASHSVRTTHAHTRHIQPAPPTTHPQMAAATGLSWLCAPWSGGERRSSRERPPRTTRYRCC